MKLAAFLPLVFSIAACSALGQGGLAQDAVFTAPHHLDGANCPVNLEAEHAGSLTKSKAAYGVQGDVPPSIPEQRIVLRFTNLLPRDIVSASITAHGFSQRGRLVPLAGASDTPDLNRTIALDVLLKQSSPASRELTLNRFAAVSAIDLDAVTYADGSTWHASHAGACSATPSLLMRITASR